MTKQQAAEARARCDAAEVKSLVYDEQDGRRNQRIESAEVCQMDRPESMVARVFITAWKQGRRDARPIARRLVDAYNNYPAALGMLDRAMGLLERWEQGQVAPRELDAVLAEWRGE